MSTPPQLALVVGEIPDRDREQPHLVTFEAERLGRCPASAAGPCGAEFRVWLQPPEDRPERHDVVPRVLSGDEEDGSVDRDDQLLVDDDGGERTFLQVEGRQQLTQFGELEEGSVGVTAHGVLQFAGTELGVAVGRPVGQVLVRDHWNAAGDAPFDHLEVYGRHALDVHLQQLGPEFGHLLGRDLTETLVVGIQLLGVEPDDLLRRDLQDLRVVQLLEDLTESLVVDLQLPFGESGDLLGGDHQDLLVGQLPDRGPSGDDGLGELLGSGGRGRGRGLAGVGHGVTLRGVDVMSGVPFSNEIGVYAH